MAPGRDHQRREEADVRVGVLGPLELRDETGTVRPVSGARLRSLLIRLAVSDGRPVSVDQLTADLWAGDGPADAANAIQALVSRLRGAAGRDVIEHGPGGYRLAVPPGQVDARAFEQLVAAGRDALAGGDQAGGAALLREALALWRGPALADVADAPYAAAPVTRLTELRLAALEDRFDAELATGRGGELVPELEELAAAHPLRERLRGQLMRALYAAGRQADALAAYEDTRRVLADELGVDPSPGLSAVHLAILRGDPALAAAGPDTAAGPDMAAGPAATAGPAGPAGPASPAVPSGSTTQAGPGRTRPRQGRLPAQLTTFVGREDELRRVGKLMAESRLVTLTGPGGAGKTRLSVEAAGRMADDAADGIWFVPLAPVRDALDVPQAVLTALGLQEASWPLDPAEAGRPPLDRLADALAARQLILVLDNCEHLVGSVAWLAGRVLAQAPGVRILATSREPLGVTGETLCPVPSLQLPPDGASAEEAAGFSAVALFADRAAAVRPGFVLGPETVAPVIRICTALDGIPLAIELAAARLRGLTAEQVADRLDDRFRLLSVGSRGTLPRHQTLRAIVDWSWDLLDEPERAVLRRLSVFSGGATPDSAEQVCADEAADGAAGPAADGAAGPAPGEVIDIIAALVDKSLVTATGEAQVRYRLLETVRAYAADRLAEAGEADRVRAAHAQFFVSLAEQGEPRLRGAEQLPWLSRLTAEHDNCAAALRFALDSGDAPTALRFVGALGWFWLIRDYENEAAAWAAEAGELAGDTPPAGLEDAYGLCVLFRAIDRSRPDNPDPALLRDTLAQVADVAQASNHPMMVVAGAVITMLSGSDGLAEARRSLAAIEQRTDPWLRAAAQLFGGFLAISAGEIEVAGASMAAGRAAFEEIGDQWAVAIALNGMAQVALARSEPGEAVRLLEQAQSRAIDQGLSAKWGELISIQIGHARAATGDTAGARADIERGTGFAGRYGEHDDEASGYIELSELARRDGDLAGAGLSLDRALEIIDPRARRLEMTGVAATGYSKMGCLTEQRGDLDEAARWHARALAALSGDAVVLPSNPTLAILVEGIAALAAARGEPDRAAELLGLAHALQGFRNLGSLESARAEAAATAALGAAGFEAAYARGRQLGRADALALVP
jgi:predicted ATPase/DNA-binding SARP family transcriptional activator